MVPEGGVLLGGPGPSAQGRRRVAPVVAAQLVHLVQQQQGVLGLGLGHGRHNPAGMAPIYVLRWPRISASSWTPPRKCGPYSGSKPGRCWRPRRSCRRRAGPPGRESGAAAPAPSCGRRKSPEIRSLTFCRPKWSSSRILRRRGCPPLLGAGVPGELQAGVEIRPQHRRLGGVGGLLAQALELLEQLLAGLLGQLQGLNGLVVLLELLFIVALRPARTG